jgi:hypothetical protein
MLGALKRQCAKPALSSFWDSKAFWSMRIACGYHAEAHNADSLRIASRWPGGLMAGLGSWRRPQIIALPCPEGGKIERHLNPCGA